MATPVICAEEKLTSEIFSYRLDDLKEIKDALNQVVTPEGKIIFLYDKRKVLIQDKESQFEIIRAIMNEFTPEMETPVPGPLVKIELFFNEDSSGSERGVTVEGNLDTGPIRIGTGRPESGNRIRVDAIERNVMNSSSQTSFLMVQSGMSSRLNVTRQVPYAQYFYEILSRYGYVESGVVFERQNVGTMLEVAPTVRGNLIDLDIRPVITALDKNRRRDYVIRELATRVTVASGSKIHIGGFEGVDNGFDSRFFGVNRRNTNGQVGFAVRATIQRIAR